MMGQALWVLARASCAAPGGRRTDRASTRPRSRRHFKPRCAPDAYCPQRAGHVRSSRLQLVESDIELGPHDGQGRAAPPGRRCSRGHRALIHVEIYSTALGWFAQHPDDTSFAYLWVIQRSGSASSRRRTPERISTDACVPWRWVSLRHDRDRRCGVNTVALRFCGPSKPPSTRYLAPRFGYTAGGAIVPSAHWPGSITGSRFTGRSRFAPGCRAEIVSGEALLCVERRCEAARSLAPRPVIRAARKRTAPPRRAGHGREDRPLGRPNPFRAPASSPLRHSKMPSPARATRRVLAATCPDSDPRAAEAGGEDW
jgi:hypothetical protein